MENKLCDKKEQKKEQKAQLYCLPDCKFGKKIEEYLIQKKIPFEKKDLSKQEIALEIFEKTGLSDSPQLIYKNLIIVGYDLSALDILVS